MTIEIEHVSKTFGSVTVLNDINLKVEDGEMLALLGPSGSGKTTLLRIIAGLETADDDGRGAVKFHGEDVVKRQVAERRVGFVFQHYALFKHLTVHENVAFGLRVRPRADRPAGKVIDERVRELLRLIRLEGFGGRYPSQLSGGQRQRVALARALAVEPRVLLLDEPFGALDAKVRKGLRDWLCKLHEELKITSILVTHDQDEALEVADRIVVMNHARVAQVGTPAEVFHHPASEFVMDFLGQVNVFHGRIEQGRAVLGKALAGPPKPGHAAADHLYVRPHELEIERHLNGSPALAASVVRVHPAGSCARVALTTLDGAGIQVELPFERFEELRLQPGETVYVSAKRARVFPPEYVI